MPAKQRALADVYRDATAVIDALGWDAEAVEYESVEVPLTPGHVRQLHECRRDLLDTNRDLLTDVGADEDVDAIVMSEVRANRRGVEAINQILDKYSKAITT